MVARKVEQWSWEIQRVMRAFELAFKYPYSSLPKRYSRSNSHLWTLIDLSNGNGRQLVAMSHIWSVERVAPNGNTTRSILQPRPLLSESPTAHSSTLFQSCQTTLSCLESGLGKLELYKRVGLSMPKRRRRVGQRKMRGDTAPASRASCKMLSKF